MRAAVLTLLLLFFAASVHATYIEGRIVSGDEPVSGLRVFLYRNLDYDHDPLFISPPSDDEGYFKVEVTAGSYALFARDRDRNLFAFCGRNPVRVKGGATAWAGLQVVKTAPVTSRDYDDDYSGAIEGVVLYEGEPLAGAYVYLYLDAKEGLKGQGYRLSQPTGADGRFAFDGLPESHYFLMARKRQGGERVGPVFEGDYLGHFDANPLLASAGKVQVVQIGMVRKVKSQPGSETIATAAGQTIRGRIVGVDGQPVAGLHVFAYTDRVVGHKRPASLSAPTGSDGVFTLSLEKAGVYYLGARQEYGDSPAPGELYGMYDESADHGLKVKSGQTIDDMVIVVEPIALD